MGIGYVCIIPKNQMEKATNILKAQHQQYSVIGVIRKGSGIVTYKN
jgi:phosphoribosylaminoimidazole (AIR) synthetase